MRWTSIRRRAVLAAMVVATLTIPIQTARGQWELWLGGWMIEVFGICGGVGCLAGHNLCATISSGSGPTYCYER